MAKDCFEGVRRAVVIIVTLCGNVQTSMGNVTINTLKIFTAATATRSGIMRGEKRCDVIIVGQCAHITRGTGAIFTTFKAGEVTIINITSTGTCTTCVEISAAESGCKPVSSCDTAGSVGIISNHICLSKGTCMSSRSRWRNAVGITIHTDSRARGCAV